MEKAGSLPVRGGRHPGTPAARSPAHQRAHKREL